MPDGWRLRFEMLRSLPVPLRNRDLTKLLWIFSTEWLLNEQPSGNLVSVTLASPFGFLLRQSLQGTKNLELKASVLKLDGKAEMLGSGNANC